MIRINEDLVLGARFTLDRSGGVLLRMFEVTGLTSGIDTLYQAAIAQDGSDGARIPSYGDPHPAVAGLYVSAVDVEPVSNSRTAARVKVQYSSPELSSALSAVKVSISGSDRPKLQTKSPTDGSLLTVSYTDPSGNQLQDFVQVPVLSPNTILQFTRQELRSPLQNSFQFRRTVNSSPWQSGDVNTWLCRAIDATSLNNLTRYEVRYVFEYDPDGWQHLEYYRDPFTGRPPDDAQISPNNDQGVASILPYGTADFNQLGLPNAF